MVDLNELAIFAQVVESQGLAAAARAIGLPKSTVSRKLQQLENRLGVRLIQRSTRRLSVTEAGLGYYRHCAAMLAEAEAAQEAIDRTQAEPRGRLRITCPVSLVDNPVGGMVSRFLIAHRRVAIDLEATNRRVDLVGEGVDLALRVRFPPLEDSDLVMKQLAVSRQVIVSAPSLIEALGAPAEPEMLAAFPSMAFSRTEVRHVWRLSHPDRGERSVVFDPCYVTEDMAALRLAALDGVGVVQLPYSMVREPLRSGALVAVLAEWAPPSGVIHAVFPSRRGQSPALRCFIEFAAEAMAAIDDA
ncbi:LysR substrate-binding domain-containing protein [Phenylobacterium sp.]|jgi:DNA-binding transcriptional LysR family regulator|uniref:LysR substrate-binding domain-containing protein n=1 Tax=Phenylobacterium sp. TaxID=1871053 RepID=UPI002E35CA52|nr:LysR substrate-binding domain-containing protein [Phenylobacterium sp.]HEX3366071.1 LysR substrate-binding domain-containing protein [Phenylobacterium sp.]